MRLDGGTVDQHLCRRNAGLCKRIKQFNPDAFGGPANVAIVERFVGPVFGLRVDPSAARFENKHDAADHAPVINPRLAARVGRKMRFNPRKLHILQSEQVLIHRHFLPDDVNQNAMIMPMTLWVWTLERNPIIMDRIRRR
jgi:hypothetical protein